jgi:hypothetical protein
MICKFENICNAIYPDLKKVCMMKNSDIQNCKLIDDIKNDNVDSFIKSLLKNESNIEDVKTKNEVVQCPRSIVSNVVLKNNCPIKNCPFHSIKLSYHCFLIHYNIFFSDYEAMPESLIINGLDVNKRYYNRLLKLSIYNSRMYLITKKYYSEINSLSKKYKSKDIKKIFKHNADYCSICSGKLINDKCKCMENTNLRNKRIKFNINWKNTIKQKHPIMIDDITPKQFEEKYGDQIFKLSFVRSMINSTFIDNVFLSDIPFGYILDNFEDLFDEKVESKAENLGLSFNLYVKAKKLFIKER